ncbi:hypothetical protein DFJ74DRAFT_712903 [Hyaloraphidium curvatum]|nr:hypothetical protein DFJ74DRAFT_712903 [Hyaloraphidium curvatum]
MEKARAERFSPVEWLALLPAKPGGAGTTWDAAAASGVLRGRPPADPKAPAAPAPTLETLPPEILRPIAEFLITPPRRYKRHVKKPEDEGENRGTARKRARAACDLGGNVALAKPLLHLAHASSGLLATLRNPFFDPNGPWNSLLRRTENAKDGWDSIVDNTGPCMAVVLDVTGLLDCHRCLRPSYLLVKEYDVILRKRWLSSCFCCNPIELFDDDGYGEHWVDCNLCGTRYCCKEPYGCQSSGVFCYSAACVSGDEGQGRRVCARAHRDVEMLESGLLYDGNTRYVFEEMEAQGLWS